MYQRETRVTWDPGVKEELLARRLKEQTIDILGQEEYTTFQSIDSMSKEAIDQIKTEYRIPSSQIDRLREVIRIRNNSTKQQAATLPVDTTSSSLMPEELVGAIIKQKVTLCNIIRPMEVLVHLQAAYCLTTYEYNQCKVQATCFDKVCEMLDILVKGPEKGYHELIKGLKQTGQKHAAKLLTGEQLVHASTALDSGRPGETMINDSSTTLRVVKYQDIAVIGAIQFNLLIF